MLRLLVSLCLLLGQSFGGITGGQTQAPAKSKAKPRPTLENVSYGPHSRHVMDLWLASGEGPRPLAIYIHGGGYQTGDKNSLSAEHLQALLDSGISVAAVNYRFFQQAPPPAALHDARRALQTLRHRAAEWNIDPQRVGAFGSSAGAITSMYLAFHDEMALRDSADPIERQSTRLTCVACNGGQTTVDAAWWGTHIPGFADIAPPGGAPGAQWGMTDAEYNAAVRDLSALHLISNDDPPIWMNYGMRPDDPIPNNLKDALNFKIHHVVFGVALKERMDELGVESHLKFPGIAMEEYPSLPTFLIYKLNTASVE